MRPIIGIVSNNGTEKSIIYSANIKAIEKAGGEPLGLITTLDDKIGDRIIESCDGFLFQGGNKIEDYQLNILNYAIKNKKPVLGICMGFEIISVNCFGIGSLVDIEYLNKEGIHEHELLEESGCTNLYHDINIKEGTLLYKLFGNSLKVNSRHHKTVVKVDPPFVISAYSDDGLIEAIEYIDNKNFILGVQFHPENLDHLDKLFLTFINRCKK